MSGGRRGFPSLGSRQSAGCPDHSGFSETSFASAGNTVPAGVTSGVRGGRTEVGTGGLGWEQSKSPPETEKRLREEVRRLLKQAEATDEEEDKRYGRERQGEELPEELRRRETRIARIQEAKKALEGRARAKAESESKDRKEGIRPANAD